MPVLLLDFLIVYTLQTREAE